MFTRQSILIMQDLDPGTPNSGTWLEISLRPMVLRRSIPDAIAYPIMGKWNYGTNSKTNQADSAYTIGTSANPEYKFWKYSISTQQLWFVEIMAIAGSDEKDELFTAAFHSTYIKANGFVSGSSSGAGLGTINTPSNIFKKGRITWEPIVRN
jgi:hypothetical protein